MAFFSKLISNPKKAGLNKTQFYFGLAFLILLPVFGKWKTISIGNIVTVESVGIVNKEIYKISGIYGAEKKYTKWLFTSNNGHEITFFGVRNDIYKKGKKQTAFLNSESPEDSFIISLTGIYRNTNGIITLILLILWISLFFVHGQSKNEITKLLLIKSWIEKLLALAAIVFILFFLTVIPLSLVIFYGWGSLIMYFLILLLISPLIKPTFDFLFYSEEQLRNKAIDKRNKKKNEALEINKEIMRRKNLKEK